MSQESEREFSSIFVFKIKNRSTTDPPPALDQLSNSLINRAFKFETDKYQSGFAKPVCFDQEILLIPYYEIAEEQITEDVTDKERPGEVIPQIKIIQAQKLTYIIDANVYANKGLVLVCKVDTIDHAQQILLEYLQTTGLDKSCIYNFLYSQPSGIMQQLLLTLYDYWPTIESKVTSIRIGGKTISAKYSGRGRYDVRIEDIDEEIRNRINAGEQIESITLKPPVSIGRGEIKIKRVVPKITINDIGVIACRANTNYENFTLIKGFIDETVNIISNIVKGKQPRSYSKLEDFTTTSGIPIQDFLPTGMRLESNDR